MNAPAAPTTPYTFDVIHTLEARSNFMLEVITERYKLSDTQVFNEIQSAFVQIRSILVSKGVAYADLKGALVPSTDKLECAFVFDWTRFGTNWYGREAVRAIVPLLEKSSSRSVLVGDWISKYRFQDILHRTFDDAYRDRPLDESRAADTLYFVYVNNLTAAAVARIEEVLSGHDAYLGCMDLTYTSAMKAMLSTMLVRVFLQHRTTILQSHEDDRPANEDVDMVNYDLASLGFQNHSVPGWLYGWFLSYKIERPILADNNSDTRFSRNAMAAIPRPIAECTVELDAEKLRYLQREKAGSLRRAGLDTLSAKEIAKQIRQKLAMNYIYSLGRAMNGDTLKFNIILENGRVARNTCALEYLPQDGRLRVITLF